MPRIQKPRSSRRAPSLQDTDYDHEIALVDHAAEAQTPQVITPEPPEGTGTQTATHPGSGPGPGPSSSSLRVPSRSSRRSDSIKSQDSQVSSKSSRKSSRRRSKSPGKKNPAPPTVVLEQPTPTERPDALLSTQNGSTSNRKPTPETAIDVLYENERGAICCGAELFSSKALGNLDPPAWTNYLHKPSPTNINTAQVPDPSWVWTWPEWRINHDEGVDRNGWEYSFMFSKKFSWHGPKFYSSYVRRRAWIRKRAQKDPDITDPHVSNSDYFTVQSPADAAKRSADIQQNVSRASSCLNSRRSISNLSSRISSKMSIEAVEKPDIEDLQTLMAILRRSRIDREKIEAVQNFLDNGGEELVHLQEQMHEIMAIFVFQASRRILCAKLAELFNQTREELKKNDSGKLQRRSNNLKAAMRHADEEVRRLEYWSDVKKLVKEGKTTSATEKCKGWDHRWAGVDSSGPVMPDSSTCDV